MHLLPFHPKHHDLILQMLHLQKSDMPIDSLPEIGYLALQDDIPVACGFLRRVEGGFSQMDTFVSNPNLTSEVRHSAIEAIVAKLMSDAKSLKLKGIIVLTSEGCIKDRAKKIGFTTVQYETLVLPLGDKIDG